MTYKEFYLKLKEINIITPIYIHELDFLNAYLDNSFKDELLKLFIIYFSLVCDGNLCMSLDMEKLTNKWLQKLSETEVRLKEKDDNISLASLKDYSKQLINEHLDKIASSKLVIDLDKNKPDDNKKDYLFIIDSNYLYLRKYYNSKMSITKSINSLFTKDYSCNGSIDILDYCKNGFELSDGQKEVLKKGLKKNLLVTGGPGTGKTTSILFLLGSLLINGNSNSEIYITAPSGKAASRMKESIAGSLNRSLSEKFKDDYPLIYNKLSTLEGETIHRLLGYNSEFKYNKNNKLKDNSIFVIDEASMIDATVFSSLLDAIPDSARVFILGDKDQLPSVECGSVFASLISQDKLIDNIVYLTESKRFTKGSSIWTLASEINNNKELSNINWTYASSFDNLLDYEKDVYNIRYYDDSSLDDKTKEDKFLEKLAKAWKDKFYSSIKKDALLNTLVKEEELDKLYSILDEAKILCAENESNRGVKKLNYRIRDAIYDKDDISLNGFHIGEILMINQNDYELGLYNGDSGLVIKFDDELDDMLYFMVKTETSLPVDEGRKIGKIFKIGGFRFYPIHMISKDEINLAYAITIHKSQGSDFRNIFVILPKNQGHPLLNRQIVYTAITRTKGNTYILSNINRLDEAKSNVLIRDTNIKL